MAAIFTAFDISGLATNVSTLLVAMIGVTLLFVAYKYGKRALGTR